MEMRVFQATAVALSSIAWPKEQDDPGRLDAELGDKLSEEVGELAKACRRHGGHRQHWRGAKPVTDQEVEDEVGDVLFVLAKRAALHGIDLDKAMKRAVDKFVGRLVKLGHGRAAFETVAKIAVELSEIGAYVVGDEDGETCEEVVYAHSEAEARALGASRLDFSERVAKREPEYDRYLAQGGPTDRQLFEHHDWHFPCSECENEVVTSDEGKWIGDETRGIDVLCHDCLEAAENPVVVCRQTECQNYQGCKHPTGELLCAGSLPDKALLITPGDPMPANAVTCAAFLSVDQATIEIPPAETSKTRENGVGLWRVSLPEAEYMIAAHTLGEAVVIQVDMGLAGDQICMTECEDLDAEETLGPDQDYRKITYRQMIRETAAKKGWQAFPCLLVSTEV